MNRVVGPPGSGDRVIKDSNSPTATVDRTHWSASRRGSKPCPTAAGLNLGVYGTCGFFAATVHLVGPPGVGGGHDDSLVEG